jgi:hypothetical protein
VTQERHCCIFLLDSVLERKGDAAHCIVLLLE